MRQSKPPSMARWMLEHGMPGGCDQGLTGDLLEEFCSGRSAQWYWRQVLGSVFIRCSLQIVGHRTVLLFAALWSMLAPAWVLAVARVEAGANLNASFSRMDWPWSTICDLGLMLATNLIFIWGGIVLYLFSQLWIAGHQMLRDLGRGILASLPALIVVSAALIVLPGYFIVGHAPSRPADSPSGQYSIQSLPTVKATGGRFEKRQRNWDYEDNLNAPGGGTNPGAALVDMRAPAIAARLPFFLVVLCALWEPIPSAAGRHKGIAA